MKYLILVLISIGNPFHFSKNYLLFEKFARLPSMRFGWGLRRSHRPSSQNGTGPRHVMNVMGIGITRTFSLVTLVFGHLKVSLVTVVFCHLKAHVPRHQSRRSHTHSHGWGWIGRLVFSVPSHGFFSTETTILVIAKIKQ